MCRTEISRKFRIGNIDLGDERLRKRSRCDSLCYFLPGLNFYITEPPKSTRTRPTGVLGSTGLGNDYMIE